MDQLDVKLSNCFGIGKFEYIFEFKKNSSNTFLLYAPNGTMKTSFAKTFELIAKNDAKSIPCDRIYENRKTTYNIEVDGKTIPNDSILVINAEDNSFDSMDKISNFIASKELKNRYDTIYQELDLKKFEFLKKLKATSQSTDCETEFIQTFTKSSKESFFEALELISGTLIETPDELPFRYNDVFDTKDNVKKFLGKNQELLDDYINNYQILLSNSKFFKSSQNSFGTYQANEILKSTEDNSFFDAGHKFLLDGNISITSAKELKEVVQAEIDNIITDTKLKKAFDSVDKAIGSNTELRAFKKVIEKNNLLLVDLKDYDAFKKRVWINYFSKLGDDTTQLHEYYLSKKNELQKILVEAKKEIEAWKVIIEKFNSRFFVPFKIVLSNQEDIILRQQAAIMNFIYDDRNDSPVSQDKESLLKVLSKGEQRAYYLLQFLFDIEARKSSLTESLLILDDVADSFDYKNKYAIIEYIKDLHLSKSFKIILLTHNFDFYRTVAVRLALPREVVYMVTKNDLREVKLYLGQYLKNVFKLFSDKLDDPKCFISLIPFVRNIIEYSEDSTCEDYITLTCCLHLKATTDSITSQQILDLIKLKLPRTKSKKIAFGTKAIKDLIFETAEFIIAEKNINEILLENKIVLSIAIRLKAEQFMIKSLGDMDFDSIKTNQTSKLCELFADMNSCHPALRTLEKVNLMTPENIHLNTFMFEPLVDMSVFHLKALYQEVNSL